MLLHPCYTVYSALPITARCLESIIRMSQAHAKLRLADKVRARDVAVAERIIEHVLRKDVGGAEEHEEEAEEAREEEEEDEQQDEDM